MVGIHDFWMGREYAGLEVTDEMRANIPMPPVHHPLVRVSRRRAQGGVRRRPLRRRRRHERSPEKAHALVEEIYDHLTQPQFVHRHHWTSGDIVIWDNRFALHAATPLDTDQYRRDMRRATINESGEEIDAYEYRRRMEV